MKTLKGYKFIKAEMFSREGNHRWELGKWYKEEDIQLCEKGFHACETALQSLEFVYGDRWFIVEARGKIIKEKGKKFVAQEMRLIKELPIDKIVKRFALWCAKDCLANYTKKYPEDKRVSECIRITEAYLDGKASLSELNAAGSAAWSARSAWSAAWSAWSAAESAWSAAESARSAGSAAWSAAIKRQSKALDKIIKEQMAKVKK